MYLMMMGRALSMLENNKVEKIMALLTIFFMIAMIFPSKRRLMRLLQKRFGRSLFL